MLLHKQITSQVINAYQAYCQLKNIRIPEIKKMHEIFYFKKNVKYFIYHK